MAPLPAHPCTRLARLAGALVLALSLAHPLSLHAAELLNAPVIPRGPSGALSGGEPRGFLTGDYDRDGHLDLLSMSGGTGSVRIYWNDGSARFPATPTDLPPFDIFWFTKRWPNAAAQGWLEANTTFGFAIASDSAYQDPGDDYWRHTAWELRLYPQSGPRTFVPGRVVPLPYAASVVRTADLDGDAWLDVIVAFAPRDSGIMVLLDAASPAAPPPYRLPKPGWVSGCVATDLDGDGLVDLSGINGNELSGFLFPGDGNGGFGPRIDFPTEGGTLLDVVDFDGLHGPDLLYGSYLNGARRVVQLANGPVSFPLPATEIDRAAIYAPGTVADVNGDGAPDVITTPVQPSYLTAHLNDGAGGFGPSPRFPSLDNRSPVAAGDFDEDGDLDLVRGTESGWIEVHPNNGDGTFGPPGSEGIGAVKQLRLTDFDLDGEIDAVGVGSSRSGNWVLTRLRGHGDGTFTIADSLVLAYEAVDIEVGKFNLDAWPDLFVLRGGSDAVLVIPGGPGPLAAPIAVPLSSGPGEIALGDVDGDLDDDILLPAFQGVGGIRTLINDGAGYQTGPFTPCFWPARIAVGHMNGDGVLDAVIGTSSAVAVLTGTATGAFTPGPNQSITPGNFYDLKIRTIDGNATNDVLVTAADNMWMFPGNGNGTLSPPIAMTSQLAGHTPTSFDFGDVDRDGDDDLFIRFYHYYYDNANLVGLMLAQGGGTFANPIVYGAGWLTGPPQAGDVNHDHRADFIVPTDSWVFRGGGQVIAMLARPTSLVGVEPAVPAAGGAKFAIRKAWPNPVKGMLELEIAGAGAGPIAFELISVGGRRVELERPAVAAAGKLRVDIGTRVPAGMYWAVATQSGQRATRKVVVLP